VDANQAAADAQWYLNYLREEGASDRDIADASHGLEVANQEVANATADAADAQDDLNKLRAGADPRELAAAERELRDANREVRDSAREIIEADEDLAELRVEIANDTAYKEAVDGLADAQNSYAEAVDKARLAEIALSELRATGGVDPAELEEAQLGVEQALYGVAQANADAIIQQKRARGEYVDAGREAHILAGELEKLLGQAPNPAARKRLEDFIALLRTAKPGAKPTEEDEAGPKPLVIPPPVMPDLSQLNALEDQLNRMDEDAEKRPGVWQKLKENLGNILGTVGGAVGGWAGAKVGGSIGASIGTGIAPGVGTVIGGVVGAIIGLLAGQLLGKLIKWVIENGGGFIEAVVSWFTGIPGGIAGALGAIWDGITGFFYDLWWELVGHSIIPDMIMDIVGWFAKLPGLILEKFIGALGWLFEKGRDILRGLWNGLWDFWSNTFKGALNVGSWIVEKIGDAASWLYEKGKDVLRGLWNGLWNFWETTFRGALNVKDWIVKALETLGKPIDWLFDIGKSIIQGLINGMGSLGKALVETGKNLIGKGVKGAGGLLGGIADAVIPGSPSKVTTKLGEAVAQGLAAGMENERSSVIKSLDGLFSTFDSFDPRMFGPSYMPPDLAATQVMPPVTPATSGEGGGDTIHINTVVQDAQAIGDEIAWRKLVRTRS
jgi:hypothetical protein